MSLELTEEKDSRRLTVIFTAGEDKRENWSHPDDAAVRMLRLNTRSVVDDALLLLQDDIDVDRIVIDRSISATEFLRLLTVIPAEYQGDVMLVQEDGTAFLSAATRGAGRVMYSLNVPDTLFYLCVGGMFEYQKHGNGERQSAKEPSAIQRGGQTVA
jgi:hypothetical protein